MTTLSKISQGEQAVTMTSREIAELTGKRHDNVRVDIQKMGEALSLTFQEKSETSEGGRPMEVYILDKENTLILISGYSIEMRARIIRRWQELESAVAAATAPIVINNPKDEIEQAYDSMLRIAKAHDETCRRWNAENALGMYLTAGQIMDACDVQTKGRKAHDVKAFSAVLESAGCLADKRFASTKGTPSRVYDIALVKAHLRAGGWFNVLWFRERIRLRGVNKFALPGQMDMFKLAAAKTQHHGSLE